MANGRRSPWVVVAGAHQIRLRQHAMITSTCVEERFIEIDGLIEERVKSTITDRPVCAAIGQTPRPHNTGPTLWLSGFGNAPQPRGLGFKYRLGRAGE